MFWAPVEAEAEAEFALNNDDFGCLELGHSRVELPPLVVAAAVAPRVIAIVAVAISCLLLWLDFAAVKGSCCLLEWANFCSRCKHCSRTRS